MNGTVFQEFLLLLIDLAIGIGIGFLFDCYRALRRLLRPGWLITQLADFLFWVCCAVLTFWVFFAVTGGEVNFYNLLIIPAGVALYLKLASPVLQRPILLIFYQLGRLLAVFYISFCYLVRLFWLAITLPFRVLWWLARVCLQVLGILLRLLWLPERMLLQWLWRNAREGWRRICRWLVGLLRRLMHRK